MKEKKNTNFLTFEVLANQIRKNPAIEGFLLPGTGGLQFKISQYADDATNFVKNERSLCHLLETVNKYEGVWGQAQYLQVRGNVAW